MELTHDFTVPASVDDTWATFMDLQRVGSCFPGAVVTDASDDGFAGTVKVKLGPIALQYAGAGTFIERDDQAHRAVIEAKGKDKRGNGTAGATVTIQLAPSGEGTRVDVTTDLSVTGKPAQFGRGVMQDVSDKLLGQFVACIESQFAVEEEGEPEPVPTPDAVAAAPSAGAGGTGGAGAGGAGGAGAGGAGGPASGGGTASDGTTGGLAPAAPRPTGRPTPRLAPVPAVDDSIDLGATVLPVLVKTYAPYAVAGIIGVLIGWLIGRRG
jgi:carbon monoxide dehydrogenase subunit G